MKGRITDRVFISHNGSCPFTIDDRNRISYRLSCAEYQDDACMLCELRHCIYGSCDCESMECDECWAEVKQDLIELISCDQLSYIAQLANEIQGTAGIIKRYANGGSNG